MARLHGLDHVISLRAPDFADDDAVGPEPEGGVDQVGQGNGAAPINGGGAGLQSDQVMFAGQFELRGILDRDDAFMAGDESSQRVQKGGLA